MNIKLQAIWRIICASEFVVISDSGLTSSYRKTDSHEVIKLISELHNKKLKRDNRDNKDTTQSKIEKG